jgi:signal transduction histidine kinase
LKRSKPRIGIKWSLFVSFIVFSAAMLILLWLFQIVFLDNFYRGIKTASIKSTAESLISNINNDELPSLVEQLAQNTEACILIIDRDGNKLYSADVRFDCVIHRMPPEQVSKYYDKALAAGGSSIEYFNRNAFRNPVNDEKIFVGPVPRMDDNMNTSLVFARLATRSDGTEVVVLLNTVLTPVSTTVQTLRVQLIYVTAILLGLSLLLALFLSRRIARPIVRINTVSKELAQGNYAVNFATSGYKEVAELADTLNHAARELDKVEQLRRELIANVSHDLRTPLTMISGYAEAMRDLPGENNPENVQVIIDEARRLTGLVNDLLDLSRLQAGSQHLNLAPYNLTESIRKILDRYGRLTDQEGFILTFEADRDVNVVADELRIDQVLYNLINNAINYTGEDKKITVRQTVMADEVLIEVADSGEGIPADQLPHIWDRYYKVDKTHRRAAIGTGLGLSIVKGALELHHAAYGVDSTPDKGSIFWFKLRLAGPTELEQTPPARSEP